jgi:hypothetical protein
MHTSGHALLAHRTVDAADNDTALFRQNTAFAEHSMQTQLRSPINNVGISAFLFFYFVIISTWIALHKDIAQGFDELAHLSYIAEIQSSGRPWPSFDSLRLIDSHTFHFTTQRNYLNHPSPYYLALALLGPQIEGHPESLLIFRILDIAVASVGIAALLLIGISWRLSRTALYAFDVPLIFMPVLSHLAGSVNNDNAAFAGGAIALLAALWVIHGGSRAAALLALVGMIVAAWAKFTGFLLVGGFVGCVLIWTAWHGRLRTLTPLFVAAFALALAPYILLFSRYGSFVPETGAQIQMLQTGAHALGLDTAPRMAPMHYAAHFISQFFLNWMPLLRSRSRANDIAYVIPALAIIFAMAGFHLSFLRSIRGKGRAGDIALVIGILVIGATLIVHCVFSYQRHMAYGWLEDAYPRYYLPLAAMIPLGGLSCAAAISNQWIRLLLTSFLSIGPVLFIFFGGLA